MNIIELKNQFDGLTNIIFNELISLANNNPQIENMVWQWRLNEQESLSSILQKLKGRQNEVSRTDSKQSKRL